MALAKENLLFQSLSIARIHLLFANSFELFPKVVSDTRGFPYECTVTLRKGNENVYTAKREGVCAPHNPYIDRKSNRAAP